MNKDQPLNFLKKIRILNKVKVTMKSMLNINCIKNKQKYNIKKVKNLQEIRFNSNKNTSIKKLNEINSKEKSKDKKIMAKNRNFSYKSNFNRNNCTINNNINYSNNNNIKFNMINNNININNNKIISKKHNKYDFNTNKIRKKIILSEINSNIYNTNLTSLNTEISKITGANNIVSYFDNNNKNILFEKKNKNNNNKNEPKNIENNLTTNNSYHHDYIKKSDENKNKTKIIFINYPNFRRNNGLQNNFHTQTQNNLRHKPKKNLQYPKRKYNNSQKNIIMKNTLYTNYLFNGIYNSKNDFENKFTYNSNNSTINKNSLNKKYFNLSKDNSILNLTGSFNSQKHIFTHGINFIFDNNDNNDYNDLNLKKNFKKNKSSSFIENRKLINSEDIHIIKSKKDLLSNKFIQDLNIIKLDLEKNLIFNKNISKIKKFKIIKNSFNDFLKLLNQKFLRKAYNTLITFLEKINLAFNELFNAFSTENQNFKKINNKLIEEKEKIENKNNELKNIIIEKQEQLKELQQKFLTLLNIINKNSNIKDNTTTLLNKDFLLKIKNIEEGEIISTIEENEQEIKKRKIYNFNKNNLDDLDAIYFFDKINMAPQRSYSKIEIPILNLTKKNKNRGDFPIGKKIIGITNISDIKFTSNYFKKFRQAFEKD